MELPGLPYIVSAPREIDFWTVRHQVCQLSWPSETSLPVSSTPALHAFLKEAVLFIALVLWLVARLPHCLSSLKFQAWPSVRMPPVLPAESSACVKGSQAFPEQ